MFVLFEFVVNFVFLGFIVSSTFMLASASCFSPNSSSWAFSEKITKSCSKPKWWSYSPLMFSPLSFLCKFLNTISSTAMKIMGEGGSLCLTILSIRNLSLLNYFYQVLLLLRNLQRYISIFLLFSYWFILVILMLTTLRCLPVSQML